MNPKLSQLILGLLATSQAFAGQPQGQSFAFKSPLGKTEQCIILNHMPLAEYSKKDVKKETELCAIDLYAPKVALCGKTWGTSPALVLYPNDSDLDAVTFENKTCLKGGEPKDVEIPLEKVAKIKSSMNDPKTSATYSQASLLYYHLSRYFDVSIDVPVAVYRTIDKDVHHTRVAKKIKDNGRKNGAAWTIIQKVEPNPTLYKPTDDLFTDDLTQIYGSLLDMGGDKYTTDFNGLRTDWGLKQTQEFMDTAPFQALRQKLPLTQAISAGEKLARKNKTMNEDLSSTVSPEQMVSWMKDLIEITLLDHLMSQQDRVGNIHHKWHWVWIQDGKVESKKAGDELKDLPRTKVIGKALPPAEIAAFKPILIQKTRLIDNDAGLRTNYKNFGQIAGHLKALRHFNAKIYQKLLALNKDIKVKGPLSSYIATTFNLRPEELKLLATNIADATFILQSSCKSGNLIFDVKPEKFMLGENTVDTISCD